MKENNVLQYFQCSFHCCRLYCGTSSIRAEFLVSNQDEVYLNAMKAIGLQYSKTYLSAAFAQEGNRISIKRKQHSIVFLVLFSLLQVILRHKLDKCRIFTKQLRRIVYLNAVKAIRLQNSNTYLHGVFAHDENRISIK